MKTQNVNVGTDMLIPDTASEDTDLETKSLPKYLEDVVLQKRNKLATWSMANSLLRSSFDSRVIKYEMFDRDALVSDWAISSSDLVEALLSVFEDQEPEVKRVLFKMLLEKLSENKQIGKDTSS